MRNMKKLMLLIGGLTLALGWGVAFSQSQDSQYDQQRQERFEDMKQKMAQRIQDRIGKMQKSLDCVQNAQDPESLRTCLPKGNDRDSGGSGMRRGGGGSGRGYGGGRNDGGDSD